MAKKVLEQTMLVGDEETLAVLRDMKGSAERAVMRSAIGAGLTPIRKEAQKRAPADEKHRIKKHLKKRTYTSKGRKKEIIGLVYVADSEETTMFKKRKVPWTVVANFLEFGTSTIPAKAFLRGARESKKASAMAIVRAKAEERIEAEWAKANAKHKTVFR